MERKILFKTDPGRFLNLQREQWRSGRCLLRGALAGVILVGLLVFPASGIQDLGDVAKVYIQGDFVSGHVYQGNPGDYSRPVNAVRVLIVPSTEPGSYYPPDIVSDKYTNSSGSYQFQFIPEKIGIDLVDPNYYFVVLFPPSGSTAAGASHRGARAPC